MLLLERAHADHQPRDAVAAIDLQDPFGEPGGFLDVAIAEGRKKRAAQEIGIARIGLQHIEVIGGGGRGVAFDAGMAGRKVAAGDGVVGEFLRGRRLGGER